MYTVKNMLHIVLIDTLSLFRNTFESKQIYTIHQQRRAFYVLVSFSLKLNINTNIAFFSFRNLIALRATHFMKNKKNTCLFLSWINTKKVFPFEYIKQIC